MEARTIQQVLGGIGFLSLALTSIVQADCLHLHRQATQAIEMKNLPQLQSVYEQASRAPDCDDKFRQVLRREVAYSSISAAQTAWAQNDFRGATAFLLQALQYENVWQVRAMLGDIYHQEKDYSKAATAYQEALDLLQEAKESPPVTSIQAVYRKAEASRLLAPEHVPLPIHRSTGKFAGVGAVTFRSFHPAARIVPITFIFDSTDFDSKGSEAAAELAQLLHEWRPAAISLIGHSDPRGSDAYNLTLSQRRAEALKMYLEKGYFGRIRTEGRGKREPYQPMDDQHYSQEELYRLHRRVELILE